MIPMRQFLREHDISGDVSECSPDPKDTSPLDGAAYQVSLRRGHRSFDTRLHRPMGAPVPTLGEGLAEIARRAVVRLEPLPDAAGPTPSRAREVEGLQQFLGDDAYTNLLFEFGRRPEEAIEQGDISGDPARPDEMTNQEPDAIAQARTASGLPRAARYLVGAPLLALGVAGILFARGRRLAGVLTATGAAVATVASAGFAMRWRRGQQQQSVTNTLETLADQNQAIQTDGTTASGATT